MSWSGIFCPPNRKKAAPFSERPRSHTMSSYQKKNRMPNCIILAKFTCEVMRPKELLP
jgi:hypothetical protein